MRFLLLWFIGILLYRVFINDTDTAIYGIVIPLIVCLLCVTLINLLSSKNRVIVAYLFFFLTSTLTLLGIINPLTGSVTDSSNAVLFGFSFYTLSLAYLAKRGVSQGLVTSFKVANPVLLATGPIVLYISKLGHRDILFRVNYYLPFFIVGFFFFFIIGVPLAPLFQLIYSTDVISVILFALIFELFLYANFCGLSLMIYGFFGILGFK